MEFSTALIVGEALSTTLLAGGRLEAQVRKVLIWDEQANGAEQSADEADTSTELAVKNHGRRH